MNHEQITTEAHNLEKKLLNDPHSLENKNSGFCQELEKARREMSPKEFADLCKTMQQELPAAEKAMHQEHPGYPMPSLTIDMNKDGTVDKVKFHESLFAGDKTNDVMMDDCGHVHQSSKDHGMEETSIPGAPSLPMWVSALESAVKAVGNTDWYQHHVHHDADGRPVK
jgi:hypothetical protein